MTDYVLHGRIYYSPHAGSVDAHDANPESFWVLASPPPYGHEDGKGLDFESPQKLIDYVASKLTQSDTVNTITAPKGWFKVKPHKGTLLAVLDKPFNGTAIIEGIQAQAARRWQAESRR